MFPKLAEKILQRMQQIMVANSFFGSGLKNSHAKASILVDFHSISPYNINVSESGHMELVEQWLRLPRVNFYSI